MISIDVEKDQNELVIKSHGHADYNPGNDIVCSAVSALLYTLAGALKNLTTGKHTFHFQSGDTEIHCRPPDATARIIFNTIVIGLMQIEQQYPKNVKISINE